LQVCFEVFITNHLEVDFGEDHQETDPHIVRIGWSMDRTSFQLGTAAVYSVCHGFARNPTHLVYVFYRAFKNLMLFVHRQQKVVVAVKKTFVYCNSLFNKNFLP